MKLPSVCSIYSFRTSSPHQETERSVFLAAADNTGDVSSAEQPTKKTQQTKTESSCILFLFQTFQMPPSSDRLIECKTVFAAAFRYVERLVGTLVQLLKRIAVAAENGDADAR